MESPQPLWGACAIPPSKKCLLMFRGNLLCFISCPVPLLLPLSILQRAWLCLSSGISIHFNYRDPSLIQVILLPGMDTSRPQEVFIISQKVIAKRFFRAQFQQMISPSDHLFILFLGHLSPTFVLRDFFFYLAGSAIEEFKLNQYFLEHSQIEVLLILNSHRDWFWIKTSVEHAIQQICIPRIA